MAGAVGQIFFKGFAINEDYNVLPSLIIGPRAAAVCPAGRDVVWTCETLLETPHQANEPPTQGIQYLPTVQKMQLRGERELEGERGERDGEGEREKAICVNAKMGFLQNALPPCRRLETDKRHKSFCLVGRGQKINKVFFAVVQFFTCGARSRNWSCCGHFYRFFFTAQYTRNAICIRGI